MISDDIELYSQKMEKRKSPLDISKARRILNWTPAANLEEYLEKELKFLYQ
jgi:nucleoside-diphosphate-sugar epimerase